MSPVYLAPGTGEAAVGFELLATALPALLATGPALVLNGPVLLTPAVKEAAFGGTKVSAAFIGAELIVLPSELNCDSWGPLAKAATGVKVAAGTKPVRTASVSCPTVAGIIVGWGPVCTCCDRVKGALPACHHPLYHG